MTYHLETGQEEDQSKDEQETKVFDALEWPACSIVTGPQQTDSTDEYRTQSFY
ncbi:hypothetical protein ACFL0M_01540 [Thermodesulfobacteriota bacterium]